MMKREWFPHPLLSAMLAATWLLLQQSAAVPQVITAAVLAIGLPLWLDGFLGVPARPRRLGTSLRLVVVVVYDIVVANLAVARLVLWPAARPHPAWVPVPLDAHHPTAITLLGAIITMTPGTVTCVVDEAHRRLFVHALDCDDPAALAAEIKGRYEAPLRKIFG